MLRRRHDFEGQGAHAGGGSAVDFGEVGAGNAGNPRRRIQLWETGGDNGRLKGLRAAANNDLPPLLL